MRVIAGTARGRRLHVPTGYHVRPTADRTKEALFASLQPRLHGARVLDVFAGTGALGIEALSRGALTATFVERSKPVARVLRDNLESVGLADGAMIVPREAIPALREDLPGAPFDIALLDPPYDIDAEELATVLELVQDALAPDAIVVVELSRHGAPPRWPERLVADRERRYGDTVLHVAHLRAAA